MRSSRQLHLKSKQKTAWIYKIKWMKIPAWFLDNGGSDLGGSGEEEEA